MSAETSPRTSLPAAAGISAAVTVMLIATLGGAYMVSQALRNSIGVIAPDLAAELSLSAGEIGLLSSAFFIAFAAVQVPLGVCLDRFGPKACMLACGLIAVAATLLFATATTPSGLVLSRVLMGIGCSCYLMAPLAFYARRYPPHRFATLTGLQLGIGTLGTIFSTAPLAFSAATFGWRMTFVLLAAAMAAGAVLILWLVPGERDVEARPRESLRESIAGTLSALRTPSVGALFLMQLSGYSSFVLVIGLWGGPYLTHVYGYGLTARGDLLLLGAIGQAIGAVLFGMLVPVFRSHKIPTLIGAGLTAALLLLPLVSGPMPPWGLAIWLAVLGTGSAYTGVLVAHGKSLFPPAIVGRGMTLLNMGTMGGVFLSQTLTGVLIDQYPPVDGRYPLAAYQLVFAVQAVWIGLTAIAYWGAQDPEPKRKAEGRTGA